MTVATDQSPLQLSNQFGVPAGTAINQAGDLAFVGSGDSALFLRAAGASSATRLLQIDDEVPGFPGSKALAFLPEVGLNASRVLLFGVRFTGGDGLPHSALLTYDGTNYHTLISSDDAAPGVAAATYGLSLIPGSIDDSGDINFAAIPTGTTSAAFFILPPGGSAVRIVGLADTPPAACTWCVASNGGFGGFLNGVPSGSIVVGISNAYVPPLNAKGQMLISLWGGLFIGAKDGTFSLVPLAATGVCSPQSITGALTPGQASAFLNNNGVVAFTNPPNSGAICVAPAGGGIPTPAVSAGDAAPASLGGTITSPTALGLDDSGDIAFQSAVSGGTIATFALMRYHPANAPSDVVAYNCEQAPGTNGALLSPFSASVSCGAGTILAAPSTEFRGISIASDGSVSFNAYLSTGGSAIYRQAASGTPQFIALDLDGSSEILPPGVSIGLFSVGAFAAAGQTLILNNDSVYFAAYLSGGAADFAVQLGTPGNVKSLVSTADTLPSGARIILGSAPPQAAGHFVAFTAQPAAGRTNLLESDLTSGNITRVVSDNDPALATAGGPAGITVLAQNFFLNDSGQVAFETTGATAASGIGVVVLGGGNPVDNAWTELPSSCGAIFLWSPSGGLKKVVAAGDAAPNSTTPFSCVTLNETAPTPLNSAGEVLFSSPNPFGQLVSCSLCVPANPTTIVNGDYLYDSTGKITEVAAANDTLPGQSAATSFVPSLAVPLNSAGQSAFGAQLGTSTWGIYLRNGSAVQKVMANGDPVPGSSDMFGFPHFIGGLSEGGNLAFTAATSAADGLFFASAGGSIQTLALDGGAAPMPVGGTFSFVPTTTAPPGSFVLGNSFKNFATVNGESDVAFGANVTGGTADSGYFRQLQSGTLQPIVWQGQATPAGGTFNTILSPSAILASLGVGSNFSLGPDGTLGFVNLFTVSSLLKQGMFVARPDGTLLKVASTGDFLPGGGVLADLAMSSKLAAGDAGEFAFGASIVGGSARRAIYVTAIAPGTASTTTTISPLASPALAQQPVALTATVTSTTSGTATGSVTFFANGISLGAGSVSTGGQATANTSSLNAGPVSLIAQYAGDANFAPGDSAPLSVVVAGFATPPSNLTVTAGQNLVIPLTLFAPAGAGMNFTLSCSALPANSACLFDTNPVAPGPGGTSVHLTLTTKSSARVAPPFPRKGFPTLPLLGLAAFFVSLLALAALASRRAPQFRLVCCACVATFALAMVLGGCGVTGYTLSTPPASSGTPAGLASFTVTGTSGSIVISTVVNVTVQ